MPTIMPVSILRSNTDVLDDVCPGSPVFLTKNGRGCYAVLDMRDYDHLIAEQRLFSELSKGRQSGESEGWISAQDVRSHFESRRANGS